MQRTFSRIIFSFLTVCFAFCGLQASVCRAQQRFLTKEFRLHKFQSKLLREGRDVVVWLPPGYETETARRYPVLYMHDGMAVFVLWRIDEIARPLVVSGQIEPLIIVMVPNGGTQEARFDDYTPTRDPKLTSGGKADQYGRMLTEELKPFIDSEYRTLADASHTGLGGASLGGLVSLYLGLKYPAVFSRLAVMSPSVWWDNKRIVRSVKELTARPSLRIWLDIGTGEGPPVVSDVKDLRDALVKKGWALKSDLMYFEAKGASHDDEAFARRADAMLKYLYPAAVKP